MSRRYSIAGTRAVASPTKSLLGLTSAATIRPRLYDIIMGSTATPADNALEFLLQRYTAVGTGTGVTPTALDPADPAALASGTAAHSVEPTYTAGAVLLDIAQNQRSTQRWVAAPGSELVLPATANNGVGLQPINASFTGNVLATFLFEE